MQEIIKLIEERLEYLNSIKLTPFGEGKKEAYEEILKDIKKATE